MSYSIQKVRVIAYLFVVMGVAAWFQFGFTYWADRSVIPGLEMVLLPAGFGLLRRSDGWRKVSMGLVALGILTVVAVPILGYTVSPVMHVRIHGTELDPHSVVAIAFVSVYATLLFICHLWVLVALGNEEVKNFFAGEAVAMPARE